MILKNIHKIFKMFVLVILVSSTTTYLVLGSYTYSYEYNNSELEDQIKSLEQEKSDMYIQLTEINSRETILQENKNLDLYDNIFYLQEDNNE